MDTLFASTRWIHIVLGFTGLVAFWIPAFARKGSPLHVRTGRVFEWAGYVVAGSAIFNSLGRLADAWLSGASFAANREQLGFLIFLAYLGIATLAAIRHGARSVRVKGDVRALRTPFHFALAGMSILGSVGIVLYALLAWSGISVVLLALSPVGVGIGSDMLRQMLRTPSERMAWYYAHMNNMIAAGIAFHTAFLVFGSRRLIALELPGLWQVVPWVLPAAIGIPAQRILESRYRARFGEPRGRRRERREAAASA